MNTSLNLIKKSIHQATFLIFAILIIITIIIIIIFIIISAKSLGWWEAKFVCLH